MTLAMNKLNINSVYNKEIDYKPMTLEKNNEKLVKKFETLFQKKIVDIEELKKLSWCGIPHSWRSIVWKILLKYLSPNQENHEEVIKRNRSEYYKFIEMHYEKPKELSNDEDDIVFINRITKIIKSDAPRTQPDCPLFHCEQIQKMLLRILYIWNIRNPASGYVQGINDITTPFITVFLNDFIQIDLETFEINPELLNLSEDILLGVEADTYWCLTAILDNILDNYTASQPGIQVALQKIEQITQKMDKELYNHLKKCELDFYQFAFRWVYCLMIREFPLKLALRLFDTYISDDQGFSVLHIYVCAATILKWGKKLKTMNFNDIMMFLQNLPTKLWTEQDIEMLISEAYVFRSIFETSQGHLKKIDNKEKE